MVIPVAKKERIPVVPPVTAVGEVSAIKEVLLLNLLASVFDRDAKVLSESRLKTKQPYIDLVQRAMDSVAKDLAELRSQLRKKGIKITDEQRDEDGIGCVYWCRGYKASFEMLWHFAKAETEIRMRKYLGEDIRKYVRDDLPSHLRPAWLLSPAGQPPAPETRSCDIASSALLRTDAGAREQLGEGQDAGPDERSR